MTPVVIRLLCIDGALICLMVALLLRLKRDIEHPGSFNAPGSDQEGR